MALCNVHEMQSGHLYVLKEKYVIVDRLANYFVDPYQLFVVLNVDSEFLNQKCTAFSCGTKHCLLLSSSQYRSFVLLCSNDCHGWFYKAFEKIS